MPTHPTAKRIMWAGFACAVLLGVVLGMTGCSALRVESRPFPDQPDIVMSRPLYGYEEMELVGWGLVTGVLAVRTAEQGR